MSAYPPRPPQSALDAWSRRKARVREEEAERARAEAEAQAARKRAELAELSDEELLARLDLPAPEALGPGDRIAEFMRAEVPERLRRRAMRALWRADPVLANLDGLLDYGEDFARPEPAFAIAASTWLPRVAGAEAPAEPAAGPVMAVPTKEGGAMAPTEEAVEAADDPREPVFAEDARPAPETDSRPAAPPRRMVFTFDEGAAAAVPSQEQS